MAAQPLVGIIMGSKSDWTTLAHAAETLDGWGCRMKRRLSPLIGLPTSCSNTPPLPKRAGLELIIAGAREGPRICRGCARPRLCSRCWECPWNRLCCAVVDSLLSIVQMPAGVPVGTLAIGKAGAINAAFARHCSAGGKASAFPRCSPTISLRANRRRARCPDRLPDLSHAVHAMQIGSLAADNSDECSRSPVIRSISAAAFLTPRKSVSAGQVGPLFSGEFDDYRALFAFSQGSMPSPSSSRTSRLIGALARDRLPVYPSPDAWLWLKIALRKKPSFASSAFPDRLFTRSGSQFFRDCSL